MGVGSKAVYLGYALLASVFVVTMNLFYPATWASVASQVFGGITTSTYLQGYALDLIILGAVYFAAFLAVTNIKREGASDERDRWAEKMSS